jgi:hypothetical protein
LEKQERISVIYVNNLLEIREMFRKIGETGSAIPRPLPGFAGGGEEVFNRDRVL